MAHVVLKNVNKIYPNGFQATYNLNMHIKDGEFMVFVGPSGCAKSTTLNMIAGLEEITEGEIYIDDQIVNDIPPKDRDIAMVFQSYALYPHMNVFENMAFGLRLRKFPKKEIIMRVNEAAKILNIENLLDRKPKQLSGGQRQRVALGRAIVRKPKVFLFDEPLSNLDAKLRVQMRVELSKLHNKLKTTMIYVTHDQVEAMTMGDRICVLDKGRIQQIDTPLNLYEKPANLFVATFIGSPSMNTLEGTLVEEDNILVFKTDSGIKIYLDKNKINKLRNHSGKRVILGIRPENIEIIGDKGKSENVIKATVDVIENLGNEMYVYFQFNNTQMIARIDPKIKLKFNENINLKLDNSKIHIFEKQTGKNLII